MNTASDRMLMVTVPGLSGDQIEDLFAPSDAVEVSEKRGLTGLEDFMLQVGIGVAAELGSKGIIQAIHLVRRIIARARARKARTVTVSVPASNGNTQLSLRLDGDHGAEEKFLKKIEDKLEG